MPIIYEPTLLKSIAETTVNNTGVAVDIDFDFAINEGAKIEKIENGCYSAAGAGSLDVALNLKPDQSAPAASGDVFEDDDVIAAHRNLSDANMQSSPVVKVFDYHDDSIYIVKNVTVQMYGSGAVNRLAYMKVYYKRVKFSDAELGNILRNY